MPTSKSFALLILASLLFLSGGRVSARLVNVRILQTTDIAGQIDVVRLRRSEKGGGVLRLSDVLKELRKDSDNSILVDSGGAFYGSFESGVLGGSIVVKALNMIGYDLYVPAGMDFSRGVEHLSELCAVLEARKIASNLKSLRGGNPIPSIEPFRIVDVDGVRLGFIGLANTDTPAYLHQSMRNGLNWLDSHEALSETMPRLRAHDPDVVVLVAHQGLLPTDDADNQLRRVAAGFPGIDVIMGGNTGRSISAVMLDDTLYTQPAGRGTEVAAVDIVYDTVADRIVSKNAELFKVAGNQAADEELSEVLRTDLTRAREILEQSVGTAAVNFPAKPAPGEVGVLDVLLRAVATAVDAEIVLLPYPAQGIWEREQYERDLWRICPHEDRIALMMLTFSEIEEILIENLLYVDSFPELGAFGINYERRLAEDGSVSLSALQMPDGSKPHPRRRFRVAVDTFMLASGGGKYRRLRELSLSPRSVLQITDTKVRAALRRYFLLNNPLDSSIIDSDDAIGSNDD